MKLLHIGLFNHLEPQNALRSALKNVSTVYYEYDWREIAPNPFIRSQLNTGAFDTVFMQIQTEGIIDPLLVKEFSEQGIVFYNFNGDVRIPMLKWFFDVAPYSIALYSNVTDVNTLRELGHRAHYFQIGFDQSIYNPHGNVIHGGDIVFMGNNYRHSFPLSKMREDVVLRMINEYPDRFVVYGSGWPNGGKHTNYKQQNEAALYRGSSMALNINHADLSQYTSDRMFRLMACGTLCLTWKFMDIEKEFQNHKHLVYWSDIKELLLLIKHYTANPLAAKMVADAGCKYILEKYTWDYRINNTLMNIHNGVTKNDG